MFSRGPSASAALLQPLAGVWGCGFCSASVASARLATIDAICGVADDDSCAALGQKQKDAKDDLAARKTLASFEPSLRAEEPVCQHS